MNRPLFLGTFIGLFLLILSVGCGGEETAESIDATVNPALISRHTDTVTLELVGQGSVAGNPAPSSAQIVSATLDGTEMDIESVEFIGSKAVRITIIPGEPMRSGMKELLVLVESDGGDFILQGRLEVM